MPAKPVTAVPPEKIMDRLDGMGIRRDPMASDGIGWAQTEFRWG